MKEFPASDLNFSAINLSRHRQHQQKEKEVFYSTNTPRDSLP